MMSGKNAIIVMMAPSWFCTKKRNGSDFLAGSRRLAFFHSCEPATASRPMPSSMPSSNHSAVSELTNHGAETAGLKGSSHSSQ